MKAQKNFSFAFLQALRGSVLIVFFLFFFFFFLFGFFKDKPKSFEHTSDMLNLLPVPFLVRIQDVLASIEVHLRVEDVMEFLECDYEFSVRDSLLQDPFAFLESHLLLLSVSGQLQNNLLALFLRREKRESLLLRTHEDALLGVLPQELLQLTDLPPVTVLHLADVVHCRWVLGVVVKRQLTVRVEADGVKPVRQLDPHAIHRPACVPPDLTDAVNKTQRLASPLEHPLGTHLRLDSADVRHYSILRLFVCKKKSLLHLIKKRKRL